MIIKFFKQGKLEQECKPSFSFFPDGQPHVKVNPVNWQGFEKTEIHCSIRNPLELFQLHMVLDVINSYSYVPDIYIYWLFGARMDRPIDENQPNTFQIVKELLPYQGKTDSIFLLDIHNPAVIPSAKAIPLNPIIEVVLNDFGNCDIYFPDAGARNRYINLLPNHNILFGKKKRDSQTGQLSGFELEGGEKSSKRVLVLDDACDGGGTFIGQYSILKALGYEKIGLYTTHGIYSKGVEVLKDFDEVYSTNSFEFGLPVKDGLPTNNRLVVRKLEKYSVCLNQETEAHWNELKEII